MLFSALLLSSCTNLSIHKRKYRKGFYISSSRAFLANEKAEKQCINTSNLTEQTNKAQHDSTPNALIYHPLANAKGTQASKPIAELSSTRIDKHKDNKHTFSFPFTTKPHSYFVITEKDKNALKKTINSKIQPRKKHGYDFNRTGTVILCIFLVICILFFTGLSLAAVYLFLWGDAGIHYFIITLALHILFNYLLLLAYFRNRFKLRHGRLDDRIKSRAKKAAIRTALIIPAIFIALFLALVFLF
jgi:hypothetical protein